MLGTFHCLYNNEPLPKLPTGRQQLLFAFLLLHSDIPLSRKQIAFLFWPDSSEQQALTNLRKLLFDLKGLLPASDAHLQLKGGQIVWHSLKQCEIDVTTFEKHAVSQTPAHWELAAASFQGELLPGFDENWVVKRRETLSYQYVDILEKLVLHYEEYRDFDSALGYAIRLLQLDPLVESAHLNVARLYALNGNDHAGPLRKNRYWLFWKARPESVKRALPKNLPYGRIVGPFPSKRLIAIHLPACRLTNP